MSSVHPLLAIVPFMAIVWALRARAPTDLASAGADAGLVAAGLSAMACSLPCLDDSYPSMARAVGAHDCNLRGRGG
jgi:hypothetical protein